MTNEQKALETLIWLNDYLKGLPRGWINNPITTKTILDRTEAVLKGMNNDRD